MKMESRAINAAVTGLGAFVAGIGFLITESQTEAYVAFGIAFGAALCGLLKASFYKNRKFYKEDK